MGDLAITAPGFLDGVRARGEYLSALCCSFRPSTASKASAAWACLRALVLDTDRPADRRECAADEPEGLLLNAARPNVLRFMPALNVSKAESTR